MDIMIEHPGSELQVLIKEKGLTQKAFSSILGKKVSEVNELLKGKRNITIQRDYLLHQTLGTPIKYWILKQVDYDYSLLNIEESSLTTPQSLRDSSPIREQNSDDNFTPLGGGDAGSRRGGLQHYDRHSEQSEESRKTGNQMDSSVDSLPQNDTLIEPHHPEHNEESINNNMSSGALAKDLRGEANESSPQDSSSLLSSEGQKTEDEDFKKRANIFRSF